MSAKKELRMSVKEADRLGSVKQLKHAYVEVFWRGEQPIEVEYIVEATAKLSFGDRF